MRLGAALVALLLVSGCRNVLEADDFSVDRRACGGFVDVDAGCATCGADQCCAEGTACRASAKCSALYDCLITCARGDARCQSTCASQHPGDEAAVALAACRGRACFSDCAECGGVANPNARVDPINCDQCMRTSCCSEVAACAEDESCGRLQACMSRTDPSFTCGPIDRLETEFALQDCIENVCAEACAIAPDYACIGDYTFPSVPNRSEEFFVWDGGNGDHLEGIEVSLCDPFDPRCDSPSSTGTTDADGFVNLEIIGSTVYSRNAPTADYRTTTFIFTRPLKLQRDGFIENISPPAAPALSLFSHSTIELLSLLSGVPDDPARGAVFVNFGETCSHVGDLSGLVFSLSTADEQTVRFYNIDFVPTTTATETDRLGRGGFTRVPPGFVVAQAHHDGVLVAEHTGPVFAGEITWFILAPLPSE